MDVRFPETSLPDRIGLEDAILSGKRIGLFLSPG
jgi:hypothetical protein